MKKLVIATIIVAGFVGCKPKSTTEVVVNEDSILSTYSIDTVKADSVKVDTVVVKDSMK